jgi:predicted metal-dependent hydrolase
MVTQIKLGDLQVDVTLKDIKNVHLSVYPPAGRVHISAPKRMKLDTIRVFAVSKLGWIRRQQRKLRAQERETVREYLDRESHYVWGKRYLLSVGGDTGAPRIQLNHGKLILSVGSGATSDAKQAMIAAWRRDQIRTAVPALIAKWEPLVKVKVERVFVQKMKTKWGSCNSRTRSIRLNTELAKKPRICLEYIVVHEMVHLIERHHNDRFRVFMDQLMPQWHRYRQELNATPLAHEDWAY